MDLNEEVERLRAALQAADARENKAFRSLSRAQGRNKTKRVAIPPKFLRRLRWTSDEPLLLELSETDRSLKITQVDSKKFGLIRRGPDHEWVPVDSEAR